MGFDANIHKLVLFSFIVGSVKPVLECVVCGHYVERRNGDEAFDYDLRVVREVRDEEERHVHDDLQAVDHSPNLRQCTRK